MGEKQKAMKKRLAELGKENEEIRKRRGLVTEAEMKAAVASTDPVDPRGPLPTSRVFRRMNAIGMKRDGIFSQTMKIPKTRRR